MQVCIAGTQVLLSLLPDVRAPVSPVTGMPGNRLNLRIESLHVSMLLGCITTDCTKTTTEMGSYSVLSERLWPKSNTIKKGVVVCTGVGRSTSSPVPDDADVPMSSDDLSRGQSAGPDARSGSGHSPGASTPSISPSGTPGPDAMLSPSRLDALRDRMNKISAAAAMSEQVPSAVIPAATVRTDTSHMTGTMEALQQRMSLLRRKQEQL